jgi:hypothetical protein
LVHATSMDFDLLAILLGDYEDDECRS